MQKLRQNLILSVDVQPASILLEKKTLIKVLQGIQTKPDYLIVKNFKPLIILNLSKILHLELNEYKPHADYKN